MTRGIASPATSVDDPEVVEAARTKLAKVILTCRAISAASRTIKVCCASGYGAHLFENDRLSHAKKPSGNVDGTLLSSSSEMAIRFSPTMARVKSFKSMASCSPRGHRQVPALSLVKAVGAEKQAASNQRIWSAG